MHEYLRCVLPRMMPRVPVSDYFDHGARVALAS